VGTLQALQGLGIEVLTDQQFGYHQPLGEGLLLGILNILIGAGLLIAVWVF